MVNGGETGAESYDIATAALVLLTATTDFVPNCAHSVLLGGTSEADDNKETSPELRWRRDLNPRSVLADSRFQAIRTWVFPDPVGVTTLRLGAPEQGRC